VSYAWSIGLLILSVALNLLLWAYGSSGWAAFRENVEHLGYVYERLDWAIDLLDKIVGMDPADFLPSLGSLIEDEVIDVEVLEQWQEIREDVTGSTVDDR
jgi:hypothetical protein